MKCVVPGYEQGCKFSCHGLNSCLHEVQIVALYLFQPILEAFSLDAHTFQAFPLGQLISLYEDEEHYMYTF